VGKCPAITRSGNACKGVVRPGDTYCVAHDPARAGERKRSASKAGRSKQSQEVPELKAELKTLADQVREERITTGSAAVVNQIINTRARLIETEMKVREHTELEERIAALEERDPVETSGPARRHHL
jgi:hypothetical protein